jgi:hypothetical protein
MGDTIDRLFGEDFKGRRLIGCGLQEYGMEFDLVVAQSASITADISPLMGKYQKIAVIDGATNPTLREARSRSKERKDLAGLS